jgi:site-specific recombinase XerD
MSDIENKDENVEASAVLQKNIRSHRHSMRATFVTDLLSQNIPIKKVKDIVGHQDIGTTATYIRSKVSLTELRNTMSSIQRAKK